MNVGGALDASLQCKKRSLTLERLRDNYNKDSKIIAWESKLELILKWHIVRVFVIEYDGYLPQDESIRGFINTAID